MWAVHLQQRHLGLHVQQLSLQSAILYIRLTRYSMMLGEYSVELTNNRKLVVKLGQQTCTCQQWQMRGSACYHVFAVIAKENLWVYDYMHPIYKTATQHLVYNQLVHPMETHDMGTVDRDTGRVGSWVGMTLTTTTTAAYCPPRIGDSPVGQCRRAGSHKCKAQCLAGAPNVTNLDIHGALVAIPVPILMQALKAMLCRLKIYWTVRTLQAELACEVALHIYAQQKTKSVNVVHVVCFYIH